jgi:hypothetical protein
MGRGVGWNAVQKQLWLACVVCAISVVLPGFIGGFVAGTIYKVSAESMIGADPDFAFLRTLFGFAAPGAIVKWIVFEAFPGIISGAVAGAIAVKLTEVICRGARYEIAAYVTGGIYTGLVIMLGILTLIISGVDLENVSSTARNLCLVIGIWLGLFMMLEALPSPITAAE